MKKAILATKVGMTQIFNEDGVLTPVTVLQAGPCVVTQVKTVENDGYDAVQVGFVDKREKLVNKPMKGQFDKMCIRDSPDHQLRGFCVYRNKETGSHGGFNNEFGCSGNVQVLQ